jgi:2-C-methyl-D-erythritol 4-phosphate cytidylyltransferase
MRNSNDACIVLAAGGGNRFGGDTPKQFVNLAGVPVFIRTLQTVLASDLFNHVVLVVPDGWMEYACEKVASFGLVDVRCISGASTRQASTHNALIFLSEFNINKVLIHDSVRPFINSNILTDCLLLLEDYDAVDTVVDSPDTIIEASDGYIKNIPPRSSLKLGQTPQGFKYHLIIKAYEQVDVGALKVTDDCGVFNLVFPERKIGLVAGDPLNIKITYESDLLLANSILQSFSSVALGASNDLSSFRYKNNVVIGHSSGIGACIYDVLKLVYPDCVVGGSRSSGLDIRDNNAVEVFFRKIYNEKGPIDNVIVCSGVLSKMDFVDMYYDDILNIVNINLLGVLNVSSKCIKYLNPNSGGLTLFASSAFSYGRPGTSVYGATKAALVNFVQAVSQEGFTSNLRINCICPERANTPMRRNAFGEEKLDTLLGPKFVANATLNFLTTSLSGQIIYIRNQ